MKEIREVLERHGALRRFGVCLLHEHFPLADDEILVESTDNDTRISTFQPVKRSDVPQGILETAWRLDIGAPTGDSPIPVMSCTAGCKQEYNPLTGKYQHYVTHFTPVPKGRL
ncbi:MAG: hypothetical protein ABSF12_14045 [Bryobacteraceae bacterium]|jgi:hypothetical protein